jgi:Mg2+ and Co2+ transporter CorA
VEEEEDERIDIPGTHVPGWAVALIVIGVMIALLLLAWFLLQ